MRQERRQKKPLTSSDFNESRRMDTKVPELYVLKRFFRSVEQFLRYSQSKSKVVRARLFKQVHLFGKIQYSSSVSRHTVWCEWVACFITKRHDSFITWKIDDTSERQGWSCNTATERINILLHYRWLESACLNRRTPLYSACPWA